MLEKGNLKYNKTIVVPKGFIRAQRLSPFGKMRFGFARAGRIGSGLAAAYNLLLMLNRPVPLAELVCEAYKKAKTPLGLLGVHPLRLQRCFSSRYLPVNFERSRQAAISKFRPGCKGIIIWWLGRRYFSPLRFAALENDGGSIFVYNRHPEREETDEFTSFADIADEKHFAGCYIIDTNGLPFE